MLLLSNVLLITGVCCSVCDCVKDQHLYIKFCFYLGTTARETSKMVEVAF